MDKSAEQPIKPPQSFPLNQPQKNLNYGDPVTQQPPYPNNNPPAQNPPYTSPNQPYPPQYPQPVINQIQPQVVNVVNTQFGTKPVSINCQFCKSPVTTVVKKSCNICSFLLCWCTGCIFWICVQAFRGKELNCCDAQHTCPNCGQILGNYTSC